MARQRLPRHCAERSSEAIRKKGEKNNITPDCFGDKRLAMTKAREAYNKVEKITLQILDYCVEKGLFFAIFLI